MSANAKMVFGRSCLKVVIAVFLATAISGCAKQQPQQQLQAKQVGYVTVETAAIPLSVTLGGRTVAFETSEVRPQVTGVIQSRKFTEGSIVHAGQPLFEIDPSLYRANVNQASANLASAQAKADAAIALARRYKPLAKLQAVAEQDYTDALAQARIARAEVEQNRAALDTAKINLRFSTVPAPISGRIGRSLVTVGGLASATQTQPLAVIQRIDPIYVDMQQSASEILSLRRRLAMGQTSPGSTSVHLLFEDGTQYAHAGTVQFADVTVNESTGTVTLRAKFPNPNGLLLPGMFVNATFDQAVDSSAILAPQIAVQRDFDGSAFVYLVGKDQKAERRKVVAERTYKTYWVVTQGLKGGEHIITQGLNGLRQGDLIKPVPASAPQVPAPPSAQSANAGGKN